jgi:hypothetical protein
MDLTTLWVFTRTHRTTALSLLIGLVLFAAGWQLGRVMSPYYAAQPIVFSEAPAASTAATSEVSVASLAALGASPVPVVAGVSKTSEANAANEASEASEATYVGSKNSDKYHHRDCSTWKQIKEENRIWFASPEEAEKAGYTPTACTRERLGFTARE